MFPIKNKLLTKTFDKEPNFYLDKLNVRNIKSIGNLKFIENDNFKTDKADKKIFSQLNSSNFGLCIKCKKSIPFGRLMIRPESQLCIGCAK